MNGGTGDHRVIMIVIAKAVVAKEELCRNNLFSSPDHQVHDAPGEHGSPCCA